MTRRLERTPPAETEDDQVLNISLRPKRFEEFIGQDQVVENLRVAIQAAKRRDEPLEHLLLAGPPGLGKTSIAHIVAHEMESKITATSGPAIGRAGDLIGILTNLEQGDVLFIDEIHRLSKVVEEFLYPAMENFEIDFVIDKGPYAKTIKFHLKRFTFVGATTRSGLLSNPMRSRFGMTYHLEFYRPEDLVKVLTRSAKILGISLDPAAARAIAERSRGTPRIANRLLRRVRDYAQVKTNGKITADVSLAALAMAGPLVAVIFAPISWATMWAMLVFPNPGGPARSRCSSGSPRACAACTATRRLSTSSDWPTKSPRAVGRRLRLRTRSSSVSCWGGVGGGSVGGTLADLAVLELQLKPLRARIRATQGLGSVARQLRAPPALPRRQQLVVEEPTGCPVRIRDAQVVPRGIGGPCARPEGEVARPQECEGPVRLARPRPFHGPGGDRDRDGHEDRHHQEDHHELEEAEAAPGGRPLPVDFVEQLLGRRHGGHPLHGALDHRLRLRRGVLQLEEHSPGLLRDVVRGLDGDRLGLDEPKLPHLALQLGDDFLRPLRTDAGQATQELEVSLVDRTSDQRDGL